MMLHTTDGGITWSEERSITLASLVGVSFANSRYGMIIADTNSILYTSDGGSSWSSRRLTIPLFRSNLLAVAVFDSVHAAVFNSPGSGTTGYSGVYRTSDAGLTWTLTSTRKGTLASFGTPLIATVVGADSIYRSTDGGFTWEGVLPNLYVTGVYSKGNNIISVVAEGSGIIGGRLWRSDDGGKNWALKDTLMPMWPNFVSMGDSENIAVVSQDGNARVSSDGGVHWTNLQTLSTQLNSAAYANGSTLIAIGQNGMMVRMLNVCHSLPTPVYPSDRAAHQALMQLQGGRFALPLEWQFPAYVNMTSTRIQAGTDSSFATGLLLDSTIFQGITPSATSALLENVLPRHTYFWRVRVNFSDSTSTGWAGPWSFVTAWGSISGSIFNDLNADSIRNPDEPGFSNWRVDVTGKIQESAYTDTTGFYSFSGLDSGTYTVVQLRQAVWKRTFPLTDSYVFTLGLNDTLGGITFGNTYPWNTIEGTVYRDLNGNGVKDVRDPGLPGWQIILNGQDSTQVTTSDSLGHYKFKHVNQVTVGVHLTMQSNWEQILPRFPEDYVTDIETYGAHYVGWDFSVQKIPGRSKVKLTIRDNTPIDSVNVWFGIRPGASYGIYGVDANATAYDFLEGEFEIPPPLPGPFDGRFVDPHGGIGRFGQGSWTDMRGFESIDQKDTFLLTFSPGYINGGNYPMTIEWDVFEVQEAFKWAPTYMIDPRGNKLNMDAKCCGEVVWDTITDPSITYVKLVTQDPTISNDCIKRWNLVSIPETIAGGVFHNLFSTATGHPFSYTPGMGYIIQDTMHPGPGYWVSYIACDDSLQTIPGARLQDTLQLQQGWNLIGSLSSPVAAKTIATFPEGIISSKFFAYLGAYSIADTLFPTKGYWVKVSASGSLFLNASSSADIFKVSSDPRTQGNTLTIRDDEGFSEDLYLVNGSPDNRKDLGNMYEAPPFPPEGSFDVRFASHRILEFVDADEKCEIPISISGASFPLHIGWSGVDATIHGAISANGRDIPLNKGQLIEIPGLTSQLILVLSKSPELPKAFSLDQNYPNPFNPTTILKYTLPTASKVTLTVYNLLGQVVATLVDEVVSAGYQSTEWSAWNVASGVYFYRLEATSISDPSKTFTQVKKMVLLR